MPDLQDPQAFNTRTTTKASSRKEKFAEDLVYTVNHAIVCGTTDVIDPFIGTWTERYLNRRISITFHSHDDHDHHGHDHADHHEHAHHHEEISFLGNLKEWAMAEAFADLGAVPFTLGVDYAAPWFMKGIQAVAEPVVRPAFQWSSHRYAQNWAYEHGIAPDAPEVKQLQEESYRHEVEHLPHALVWTGAAAAGNLIFQKKVLGKESPWAHLAAGKLGGSAGTLVTVLSLRTLFPHTVDRLDEWNTRNIAEPITRRVSGWLGIDDETVTRVLESEKEFERGSHAPDKTKDSAAAKPVGSEKDVPRSIITQPREVEPSPALSAAAVQRG